MLTKEEAKKALEHGMFVRHKSYVYTDCVCLKKINGSRYISDQGGYICPEREFWKFHKSESYFLGWEIVEIK